MSSHGQHNPAFVGDDGEISGDRCGKSVKVKSSGVGGKSKGQDAVVTCFTIAEARKWPLADALEADAVRLDKVGEENASARGGNKKGEVDDAKGAEGSANGERQEEKLQPSWNNSIEFLMSCIAVSVGFGNIWRFPFTAYENGGGAFLIPYVILLFLVGKPFYFLEMIIGQFSGSSSIKVWKLSPGFAGVGWAQLCSTIALATYYSSLMALTLFYLISSFAAELPWAKCREEWGKHCVDSNSKRAAKDNTTSAISPSLRNRVKYSSSAELYFSKVVLREKEKIDEGIGLPEWKLTLCLLVSWLSVLLVLWQGMKSTGRASYFLAIFPYVVLLCLLARALTLEGALDGILFFISPNWSRLLDPTVWYAAVTQCFFSLSVCFGAIITYSTHNQFNHDIYRDAMIVTTLDTFTSAIAGCTIFGILGNLAYELGEEDIGAIVKSGAGLAFVSYPDAIAKFTFLPQFFSVLFFVMMFVLGVGSAVGMTTSIIRVIEAQFPSLKHRQIVLLTCFLGFLAGTVYVTPGGQFVLTLVDYYGTSFVVFILAFFEIIGVVWVYGLENLLEDVEFMLDRKPSVYWRICWLLVTPLLLLAIFIYTLLTLEPLTYGGVQYPSSAHAFGWLIFCVGTLQIPIWMMLAILKNKHLPLSQAVKKALEPARDWGPPKARRQEWLLFKENKAKLRSARLQPAYLQKLCLLFNVNPK